MDLFGNDDSELIQPKRNAKHVQSNSVLTREERKYLLSQIARGKTTDAWILFRDMNLKVRLTPSIADRIKAIQVLNDMDELSDIKHDVSVSVSFYEKYLKEVQQANLQDDRCASDKSDSGEAQSESESGVC